MKFRLRIVFVLFLILSSTLGFLRNKEIYVRLVRVVDGDTFIVNYNGNYYSVRLIGIDAPETSGNFKARRDIKKYNISMKALTSLGKLSKRFAQGIVKPGTKLRLEFDVQKVDRYGRLLGYLYLPSGEMINEIMLREGYAMLMTIPPNVKYVKRFRQAFDYAVQNRKGLWR
ncbi:MAG: thermonuclease family protein [bacterium]